MSAAATPLMEARHLSIDYIGPQKTRLKAVEDVSFTLHEGEMLGLVGESGCGKTTLMLALLRLLPAAGRISSGQILFQGRDLLALNENEINQVRWRDIAMIFQGAMNALNPVTPVGDQIAEAIQRHTPWGTAKPCTPGWLSFSTWWGLRAAAPGNIPSSFRVGCAKGP